VRKLLITLLVLAALLLVADRVAVRYADRAVADRMQENGRLQTRPDVAVLGFPFLTQAISGSYQRVDVHIRDLQRNGVTLSRLDVTVRGAKLPLSKVGSATDVPVDSLQATAVVSYLELAHDSGLAGVTVRPAGDHVEVTGKVAGVSVTAKSTLALKGDRIVVTAQSISALGVSAPTGRVLDFSVRIPALPFGLHLDSAVARADGVHLTASSGPTTLTPQ
jgi:hypothetical protein